jgi:O-antigen/teichoic acid export membrane protein
VTKIFEHGRVKKAIFTGFSTIAVRGVTVAAGLFSIPITSKYLGVEKFGLWLTLSTLLTWISIADLGLANSLTNVLASANELTEKKKAREAVSSAFWLMIGISMLLGFLFLLIYPIVPWARVFNVTSIEASRDSGPAVLAGMIYFTIRLPLSIPGRIYTAYQEGYYYQLLSGLSSITSVISLIVAINLHASLFWMVLSFFGSLLLGDLISAIHIFGYKRPWLSPSIFNWNWLQAKNLLGAGLQFWIIQVSAIAYLQTDLLIVTQLFGASAVASYGVTLRLFSLVNIIQIAFLAPLWPAYAEALSKKDTTWIIRTFKTSILISLAWSITAGICLLQFSQTIIRHWVSSEAVPSYSLLMAMLVTTILTTIGQCISIFMNGLSEIRSQVIIGCLAGLANLILSLIMGHLIGSSGVAWATGICVLVFSVILVGRSAIKQISILTIRTT